MRALGIPLLQYLLHVTARIECCGFQVSSLKKYVKVHDIPGVSPLASKEDLLMAVTRHFSLEVLCIAANSSESVLHVPKTQSKPLVFLKPHQAELMQISGPDIQDSKPYVTCMQ